LVVVVVGTAPENPTATKLKTDPQDILNIVQSKVV